MKKILSTVFLLFLAFVNFKTLAQSNPPTMSELIGVDTDTKTPVQKLRKFSHVREYHEWGQDIGYDVLECGGDLNPNLDVPPDICPQEWQEDNSANPTVQKRYGWNPSYDASAYIWYDDFFGKLRGKVTPALKSVAPETRGLDNYPGNSPTILEEKPLPLTGQYFFNTNVTMPPPPPPEPWQYPSYDIDQVTPATYLEYARWMSMVTTRYGQITFNGFQGATDPIVQKFYLPRLLGSNPAFRDCDFCYWHLETPDFGRGDLSYLEIWNEQDQTWTDEGGTTINLDANPTSFTRTYFYPNQYAAMLSAAYDGHQQDPAFLFQENTGDPERFLGIKNIDPGMKVVIGGTAGLRQDYINGVVAWCENNRTAAGFGILPFDVLNFHHYSSSTGQSLMNELSNHNSIQFSPSGVGISPEADDLRGRLSSLLNGLSASVDGKEFWLSEFGYDTEDIPDSGAEVPEIGDADREKVQGQWLVRSLLEISAAKNDDNDRHIDRAMVFIVQDPEVPANLPVQQFDRSGMLKDDGSPKRSWFYVLTLKNILGDYSFDIDQANINMDITVTPNTSQNILPKVYKYEMEGSSSLPTYVIWSPTANGTEYDAVVDFTASGITQATLYEIKELDENGRRTDMVANGTSITVPVSETPIFLRLGEAEVDPLVPAVSNLQSSSSCCGSVELSWTKGQPFYSKYAIYYALKSEIPPPTSGAFLQFANFEDLLPDLTLYEEISGLYTSYTLTGLTEGEDYWFFVIPYDFRGNTGPIAIAAESIHFIGGSPGDCLGTPGSPCIYPVAAGQIIYNTTSCPANLAGIQAMFGINDAPGGCSMVSTDPGGGAAWSFAQGGDPICNTVTVDFEVLGGETQLVKTLYVRNFGASGRLLVEYSPCICPNVFFKVPVITLPTSDGSSILSAYSNLLPERSISKIRFTRLDNRTQIHRIFFCSKDLPCIDGMLLTGASAPDQFRAEDITPTTALLLWEAARLEEGDVNSSPVGSYEIEYGTSLDAQGEILNPTVEFSDAEAGELEQMFRLTGLQPNTTYHTRVKADYPPCSQTFGPGDGSTNSFTTPPLGVGGRSAVPPKNKGLEKKKRLRVFPNPNAGRFEITLPRSGYSLLEVFDLSGRLVLKMDLPTGRTRHHIDRPNLPNGMLMLRVSGNKVKSLQGQLMVGPQ